jgi:iron complex outermembrane recepter protein
LALSQALPSMAESEFTLEEVVVTATKRAQGLQDVPIAISVMTGEKIQSQGIAELEDLAVFMPNVHIAEGGTGTQLFIRGIGSGINYGFEQSVGTFIDGVYYGRGRSARAAFLDLERVEILKGPQSTLFGKNTVAGAINITSALPTEEFEGYVEGSYDTELEGYGVTAMVSGELADGVKGRLVAKYYDDKGYIENTGPGDDGPMEENSVVRGTLVWDASEDLTLTLKAEHGQFDVTGRQDMITIANPTATSLYQAFGDPNFNADFNYEKSAADFPGNKAFDDTKANAIQLTADYQWGEHSLRSITAYNDYEFDSISDSDYSPLQFIEQSRSEKHDQFSQEFLLSSPTGGELEYLAGVYYQRNNLTSDRRTDLALSALPPIETSLGGLFGGLPPGAMDGGALAFFDQKTETWSAFTQLTWNASDIFRVTFGLRYSKDEKEVEKSSIVAAPDENVSDPFLAFLFSSAGLSLANEHDYSLDRSEEHWTGNLNFQLDINDDTMMYLNFSNGFKGGGFDESNALGNMDFAEFEDESVQSIEFGAKVNFWDGRARANMAIFYSEFEDVQVSTFDGNCCFVVGNAAESEVEGFEADIELALAEGLVMTAAISYLDATYKSFPNAACNESQFLATIAAGGARSDCLQDLSGKPLQFAPEWSGNIGLRYEVALSDQTDLTLGMEANFSDDVVVANDLDENLIQDSFWKLNMRASLSLMEGKVVLSAVGKNLTNEKTFTWGNDVPLASLGFSQTYFQHIDKPRTFELKARYNF